jgi:hypothetical protein
MNTAQTEREVSVAWSWGAEARAAVSLNILAKKGIAVNNALHLMDAQVQLHSGDQITCGSTVLRRALTREPLRALPQGCATP